MEEFRKLYKEDLYEIISVAKQSYDKSTLSNYVLDDIISSFDDNQRYKVELYGFFQNNKLIHFGGFGKTVGIGYCYELRLATTLPEFRGMGYNTRSHERRMAAIASKHRDEPVMVQVATKRPDVYIKHGFKESGHNTLYEYVHLFKLINKRRAL